VTELGRVASHYYIRAPSIVTFMEKLNPHIGEGDVLAMMALSSEFESMAVRWGGLEGALRFSRGKGA
jgi:activating signal cointegrator complex subunit 3